MILSQIVKLLEERNWEYAITEDGRSQIILGNTEYDVSKYDEKMLQQILNDVLSW